jgi:TRAP-type mannitol/chloroaromatic compound transport system substrate-binding protein
MATAQGDSQIDATIKQEITDAIKANLKGLPDRIRGLSAKVVEELGTSAQPELS